MHVDSRSAKIEKKDPVQKDLNNAVLFIEEMTGLKLSNIERFYLHKIAKNIQAQTEQEKQKKVNGFTKILPYKEIPARFFYELYDLDFDKYNNLPRTDCGFDKATQEWFKKEQEERHLI